VRRFGLLSAVLLAVAGFVALGVWQLQRREWKHALMAEIAARIHAAPVEAPDPSVDVAQDAYLRVQVRGVFRSGADTLVQAVTSEGGGFWVMTPLVTDRGFTVLVNRGFVPPEGRAGTVAGEVMVSGLLRVSEPGGGFLRANAPGEGRWYSRDVAAIAQARGLSDVAPYFIDADRGPGGDWPMGGLTVVALPDNHLVYALTWFGLAGLGVFAVGKIKEGLLF
jgi:surfeit locus 1 family protein